VVVSHLVGVRTGGHGEGGVQPAAIPCRGHNAPKAFFGLWVVERRVLQVVHNPLEALSAGAWKDR
jgi:hypothetical protein